METRVFCIIVTYNSRQWTDKCLKSLSQSEIPVSVVVVDNKSKDDTVAYIRSHYKEVYMIANEVNYGFGRANNMGIEYAYRQGATHFLLLNQDAWITPGTIGKLIHVQQREGLSVVSPVHLNGKGDAIDKNFFKFVMEQQKNKAWMEDLVLGKPKDYYPTPFVNAAVWLITRPTIDDIGGFDPLFFHYGEDVNYCQRLQFHGKKMGIASQAFAFHDRDTFGNAALANRRLVLCTLEKEYADVNQKVWMFSKQRIRMHLSFLWHAVIGLCALHPERTWNIIRGYAQFLKHLPQMIRNRCTNQSTGHHWLDLP